jgi:hypothetical protein
LSVRRAADGPIRDGARLTLARPSEDRVPDWEERTMARYSVGSNLRPEDIIEKAKEYFGEGGVGLSVTGRSACCVYLEGGGGHVSVTASNGKEKTQVEIEVREWDYQARSFMNEIG